MEEQNKNKDGINEAKEPLEPYFQSPGIHKSSKRITFSTLEEREEENYRYWLSLTPEQRLENVFN